MGTMFQVISCHDLLHQNPQFFFIAVPAGLDGGLAGNSMEGAVGLNIRSIANCLNIELTASKHAILEDNGHCLIR